MCNWQLLNFQERLVDIFYTKWYDGDTKSKEVHRMSLGENIYRLRTKKNMSQGDLANALDVSRQSVSKWENDSATPELEKLIKMSNLFGVTLDELVGRTAVPVPSQAVPSEEMDPETGPILHNGGVPVQMTMGLLLICFGIAAIFWLCIAAWLTGASIRLGVVIAVTMILCGILCFVVKYPYVYWGWCLWGAYLVYTFVLTPQWEKETLLLIFAGIFLIALLVWTIRAHRKGTLHVPQWLWWLGGLILAGLLILFFMNYVPPFWISASEHSVAHG